MVLKNFILASREVFERHSEKFMAYFKEINDDILPMINKYLAADAVKEYPILSSKVNADELRSHFIVAKKELEEVMASRNVEDKFIKFDEQARK